MNASEVHWILTFDNCRWSQQSDLKSMKDKLEVALTQSQAECQELKGHLEKHVADIQEKTRQIDCQVSLAFICSLKYERNGKHTSVLRIITRAKNWRLCGNG